LSVRVSGEDRGLSVKISVEYGPAVVYLSIIQAANFKNTFSTSIIRSHSKNT